jgi:DNA-3-methyladenine glycosylase
MRQRRHAGRDEELTNGPGKLTEALGIGLDLNGVSLEDGPIQIEARAADAREPVIVTAARIGITKAIELPWRFCDATSRFVSRPWPAEMREAQARVRRSPRRVKSFG